VNNSGYNAQQFYIIFSLHSKLNQNFQITLKPGLQNDTILHQGLFFSRI